MPSLSHIVSHDSVPDAMPVVRKDKEEKGKGKTKKERWNKRASRKAPDPPIMSSREASPDFEIDWERIRTLPRVRLVPPEGEWDEE